MKILSIGNSFSQDAQRYFGGICRAAGVEVKNTNLYIGGCSLERHVGNIGSDSPEYMLEECGKYAERHVTLDEMISADEWDVVTLQEVSGRSFDYKYFEDFLPVLADYVHKNAPNAKIALHITWGYENGSERLANAGFATMKDMFSEIEAAYVKARELIGADILIPSGRVIQRLADEGYTVHRDTFHLALGLGRYAVALTWFKTLFGGSVLDNSFASFDEPVTDEEIAAVKRIVEEL